MELLANYGYIGLFLAVAILFPIVTILIPKILTIIGIVPHKPNSSKYNTYECGLETIGKSWVQFNFRYYFLALLFLVFDIETIFLYPWAVAYKKLALFGLIEMFIFIAILVVGYIYAWKKSAFEWK